ncbi:hypothetical protein ABTF33_18160, partial [Acinetobacter baumannii]
FRCRLIHLKIILWNKPLEIGLCNKAMNNIEYDAVVESAKIKAKSDITVAVLNNAASTGLVAINDASKEKLIEFIKKLHDQIDE